MPPSAPKSPAEPDWELLRQKKPALSAVHIERIAELSEVYLQPEAAEFAEGDQVSSLRALYELSKQQGAKMSKAHAKKIQKMVIGAEGVFGRRGNYFSHKEGGGKPGNIVAGKSLTNKSPIKPEEPMLEDKLLEGKINRKIAELKESTIRLATSLIAINTENLRGGTQLKNYSALVEAIKKELQFEDIKLQVYEKNGKPNLVARWDVGAAKTLHVNGHYDTVPCANGWDPGHDPFKAVVDDGKLYGLGACDMKGSLAAMVIAARAMHELGLKPACNVELSFTCDEETGGLDGAGYLLKEGKVRPDYAIVLDGDFTKINNAHKGVLHQSITISGKGAFLAACSLALELDGLAPALSKLISKCPAEHEGGNTPTIVIGGDAEGRNAHNQIQGASAFIVRGAKAQVDRAIDRFRKNIPEGYAILHGPLAETGAFKVTVKGKSGHASQPYRGRNAFIMACRLAQELEKQHMMPTAAGNMNEKFVLTIDRRIIPEEILGGKDKFRAIKEQIGRKVVKLNVSQEHGVKIETLLEALPSKIPENEKICRIVKERMEKETGGDVPFVMATGFLDMRHFVEAGIPTVNIGPEGTNAHGPNEYVVVSTLSGIANILVDVFLNKELAI